LFPDFYGMAPLCLVEGSVIIAEQTHQRMFLNSKFYHFRVYMLNSSLASDRERGRLALSSTVHEQAQSNRAYNIVNFAVLGFLKGFCFLYFIATSVLFVPCSGCKMSARTF
jgi:hypothetical protein